MSVTLSIDSASQTRSAPDTAAHCDVIPEPETSGLLWWVTVVSILPFLAVPAAHLLSQPETATGLFHYELPYYVANGRAAIERGNGILYPNPFDPSVDAPIIYAHWLPVFLGVATAVLGADPGTLILALTVVSALLLAVTTVRLTRESVSVSPRMLPLLSLAAMWGGGGLVAAALIAGFISGHFDPLQFDPGNGLWFLNWGRNALFPTEAIYHSLCACCWVAEIRRRSAIANVFLLLLATTHPWSGLELLLTVNLWRGCLWFSDRRALHRNSLIFSALTLFLFLAYYKLWLPSFEQHAALQQVWELDWSLAWSSAIPAWGIVAAAAIVRLTKDRSALRQRSVQFLLCALVVATGLSLHDRLIHPVQPLHFTRGYVWMPLFLLGAPVLVTGWNRLWRRNVISRIAACGATLFFVSDNLVFSVLQCRAQLAQEDGFHLDLHDRALFEDLHRQHPGQTVLTESMKLNYLLPAYTDTRPWLGHQFNTPDFRDRQDVMQRCFADQTVNPSIIPADATLLIILRDRDCQPLSSSGLWIDSSLPNARWLVWTRLDAPE